MYCKVLSIMLFSSVYTKNEYDYVVSGIYMLVVENIMFQHLCGNQMFSMFFYNI
jgi:hypothetical protein